MSPAVCKVPVGLDFPDREAAGNGGAGPRIERVVLLGNVQALFYLYAVFDSWTPFPNGCECAKVSSIFRCRSHMRSSVRMVGEGLHHGPCLDWPLKGL